MGRLLNLLDGIHFSRLAEAHDRRAPRVHNTLNPFAPASTGSRGPCAHSFSQIFESSSFPLPLRDLGPTSVEQLARPAATFSAKVSSCK